MAIVKVLMALISFRALHIVLTLALARMLGVDVRAITLGSGPVLFERGRYLVRLVPLTAAVHLKDTRVLGPEAENSAGAFNYAPLWAQLTLILVWPFALLLLASILLGQSAASAFSSTFEQVALGAVSPHSAAQTYLSEANRYLELAAHGAILGVVAAKLAAIHLLPYNSTAITAASMAILFPGPNGMPSPQFTKFVQVATLLALVAIGSWLVAIGLFAWNGYAG